MTTNQMDRELFLKLLEALQDKCPGCTVIALARLALSLAVDHVEEIGISPKDLEQIADILAPQIREITALLPKHTTTQGKTRRTH